MALISASSQASRLRAMLVVVVGLLAALLPFSRSADETAPKPPVAKFAIRLVLPKATPDSEAMIVNPGTKNAQTLNVQKEALLEGPVLKHVEVVPDPLAGYRIRLEFTKQSSARLAEITRQYKGEFLAVVIDGKVLSAPMVTQPIDGGVVEVFGHFTQKEAEAYGEKLKKVVGAMAFPAFQEEHSRVVRNLQIIGIIIGALILGRVVYVFLKRRSSSSKTE